MIKADEPYQLILDLLLCTIDVHNIYKTSMLWTPGQQLHWGAAAYWSTVKVLSKVADLTLSEHLIKQLVSIKSKGNGNLFFRKLFCFAQFVKK